MPLHSFIAGTPLHLMISLSLIRELNLENNAEIKIIDYFSDARNVCRRLSELDWHFSSIKFSLFPSHRHSYVDSIRNGSDYLYIDNDASFQRYLDLIAIKTFKKNIKVQVFEDGVGSYRTDLYHGLKKKIFDKIGVATHMGGSPFTDKIFVFEKDRYDRIFSNNITEVVQISTSPRKIISEFSDALSYVFHYNSPKIVTSKNCNIYLSCWEIDFNFLLSFSDLIGDKFVKLHPHIKNFYNTTGLDLINNSTPAEIVLLDMLEKYEKVFVYHHGTSVEQYISNDRLTFIEI